LADKGYQGISKLHSNSTTPIKETKNHKLSSNERTFNSELPKQRIYIEHINRYKKRFRILSGRYRNKRKKFSLRVSPICGIYNFRHSFIFCIFKLTIAAILMKAISANQMIV